MRILLAVLLFFSTSSQLANAQEKSVLLNMTIVDQNKPVKGAHVIINQNSGSSNELGHIGFSLAKGKYILKVSHSSYQEKEMTIMVNAEQHIIIPLKPIDQLEEVLIFSKEGKGLTTKSIINKQAMEHLQPSSFSDLMELLPGGLAKTPSLSSTNRALLRENSPNIGGADYHTSSLGIQFMIDDNIINSNADLLRSVDNDQFLNAGANRETLTSGVDMRTISTNDIEKVEIIRGIPSASYGDLTSGIIKIERKIGQSPLQARFKADGFSKQYYLSKGFKINNNWELSAGADFLDSKADPRDDFENYQRVTASIRSKKKSSLWSRPLEWRSSLDFSTNIDLKKYDPDNGYPSIDQFKSKRTKLSVTNNFIYSLDKHSFFNKITLNTALRQGIEKIEQLKLVQLSGPRSLSLATEQGESVGVFPALRYIAESSTEGKPLDISALFQLNGTKKIGGITNEYETGLDWRFSKNNGAGQQYDLLTPPSALMGTRPRTFKEIPASQLVAAFVGNQMNYAINQHQFSFYVGLRFSKQLAMDPSYAISNKVLTEPRLNFQYRLPHLMINDYPLKTDVTIGYGLFYKQPTLSMLYPNQKYWDYTQLSYYNNDPAYRYVNFMTYIQSVENKNLEAAKSLKKEVRVDLNYRNNEFFITYFNEDMSNGFRNMYYTAIHTYKQYHGSQVDLSEWDNGPNLNHVPYTTKTNFGGYSVTENGSATLKKGIEFGYTSPRFKSINTRFTLTAAYFKTQYRNTMPVIETPQGSIGPNGFPYYGIYENDLGYVNSSMNYNLFIDTYLPSLDLTISASLQGSLFDHRRKDQRIAAPISYYGIDGIVHLFTPEDAADPYKQWLVRNVSVTDNLPTLYTFTLNGNIKITKSIYKALRTSMFVTRLFNYTQPYTFNNVVVNRRGANTPYFGMELNYNF